MGKVYSGDGFVSIINDQFFTATLSRETGKNCYTLRVWPGSKPMQKLLNWQILLLPGEIDRLWRGDAVRELEAAMEVVQKDMISYVNSIGSDKDALTRLRDKLTSFNETAHETQ